MIVKIFMGFTLIFQSCVFAAVVIDNNKDTKDVQNISCGQGGIETNPKTHLRNNG